MPVQSTVPDLKVTRPEMYFGELTNNDVYVRTRQKEFNYPQGETNNQTSYEGTGGIQLGGIFRRLLIAIDRGDLTKLPFSDDINGGQPAADAPQHSRSRRGAGAVSHVRSRSVHRRHRRRKTDLWMMDGFTTSETYPYARHYRLENERINYVRNSVKATIDAYDGDDDVLRLRRGRSDHRRLSRDIPDAFSRRAARCRPTCAATCAIRS